VSTPDRSWEPAYLAVSAVLGEPLDAAMASLPGGGGGGGTRVAALLKGLRSPLREARARALADALSEVALAVDAMSLG
jgi:hypothetical protein